MSLDELYQDLILDHFRNPRGKGALTDPTAQSTLFNPLCGDEIGLALKINRDQIGEIGFTGKGCALSQASASMLCELLRGAPVTVAHARAQQFFALMRGEIAAAAAPELGDALSLEGVKKFTARMRCVLLAWEALEQALRKGSPSS